MSQKEILAIAIKVLSLWLLCWLFLQVSSFIPMLATLESWQGNQIPTWVYLAICSSFLASGFIISKMLFAVSNSALDTISESQDILISSESHKYILQVCGLFFIASSLTFLPSSVSFLVNPATNEIHFYYFLKPFGYVLQFSIGIWLIVHPSWWVLLLSKLRGRA